MTQIGTWGSAKVCGLRVARLGANCAPLTGATNGVATSAIVRLNASPQYDAGQEYLLKNGCGDITIYSRESDRLKEMALTMELATKDFELIEMLTGGQVILDSNGKVIGISRRGVGKPQQSYVSVEIWTTTIDATGVCSNDSSASDPQWFRVVYPRATFTLGDHAFANEVAVCTLSGFGTNNPLWGNGPWNDFPGAASPDATSPEHIVLDAVGPPALQSGYISVPTQS